MITNDDIDVFEYTYEYKDYLDEADTLSKIRCETNDHDWIHHFRSPNELIDRCDHMCGIIRKRRTFYYNPRGVGKIRREGKNGWQ